MENIIKNLQNGKWNNIKKAIIKNEIDWNYLVDQTNGLLHYLTYHNKIDLIKIIDDDILKNIINQPNIEGDTICHIASKLNNIDIFNLSIQFNPNIIYQQNRLNFTPLHYLVPNTKLIKKILKKNKINDHYINNDYTLLDYYILDKNLNMTKFLLKYLVQNYLSNQSIFTVLQSENSDEDKLFLLELMFNNSMNLNILDQSYMSPLIISVNNGMYPVTKFLLENGADINYSGPEQSSNPLVLGIMKQNIPIIKLLLEFNPNTKILDKYLRTPIHYLFINKNDIPIEIKKYILGETNSINSVDNTMNSILNLLIQNDDWKLYLDILANKKLKIYLENKDGIKPIDFINKNDADEFFNLVYKSYINQLRANKESKWNDIIDNKISEILLNGQNIQAYKNYIMKKILNGQSYPSKNKKSYIIDFIVPPETNITHFSAYSYNYILFIYYILKKYSHVRIPVLLPEQIEGKTLRNFYLETVTPYMEDTVDNDLFRSLIKDYINHYPGLINHVIIWKNKDTYFISSYFFDAVKETLKIHPDTKYMLFKLTIVNNDNFNHANILIYDVLNNFIERFDPYGKVPFYETEIINKTLSDLFKKNLPKIKFLSPTDSSQGISYQVIADETNQLTYVENDPVGFCIAWCLWYIEMRLKNPDIHPKKLIKKTIIRINKSSSKFKDFIRNYAEYLDNEKNKLLELGGIPKKYWYMLNIPYSYYKPYLRYFRTKFLEMDRQK